MRLNKMLIPIISVTLTLTSCGQEIEKKDLSVGDSIRILNDVKLDYENTVFDDFSGGVDDTSWYIGNQAWGSGNGGVIPQNVSYTDDGILVLTGNGKYHIEGDVKGVGDLKDGRNTGAALISKFLVGPGRYEIKMKVHPRLGACTAFWTYAFDHSDSSNHEIDIELPGGTHKGMVSFSNILNTNYHTETLSHSQDTKVSDIINEESTYLNDGRWHTFGFDWYTDPSIVVYSIDGKVCAISETFVPYKTCRLWLGVWFPSSGFVGSPEFDTDQMLVDYVNYIPFKDQPVEAFTPEVNGVATTAQYPAKAVALKTINKIANGNFEFENDLAANSGWNLTKYISEKKPVEEVSFIQHYAGSSSSNALVVKDDGVAIQELDAIYPGYKHTLTFKAKGKGILTANYMSSVDILKSYTVTIDSDDFKEYSVDLEAPIDTMKLKLLFDTTVGNQITVDDVTMLQK